MLDISLVQPGEAPPHEQVDIALLLGEFIVSVGYAKVETAPSRCNTHVFDH